ncbi:hypothetical protein NQ318_019746 [Aromia moschata]|uniref:Uncharacterized protein n=1 Tax=Aromia moschata TaxID=1265417 RepID=A0AAV8XCI0_9CUCU|nr:hypothetical protein NQ318_019746 [Aromia moschata]
MVVRPKKDERKKSKASEQLGRPVHHNKENQRPGLTHPAVSKKQAEGYGRTQTCLDETDPGFGFSEPKDMQYTYSAF